MEEKISSFILATLPPHVYSLIFTRCRILGRNWDKSLKSFPPCYSQSLLLTDFTPPPLEQVCNVKIVCGNLKSENSQDYAQKLQRNCTFMNSASVKEYEHCHVGLVLKVGLNRIVLWLVS
jgi:hypothetical protein